VDVTVKTEKTYLVVMTESQATDLLQVCVNDPDYVALDIREPSIEETLDDLRQVLLNAGVLLAGPKPEDAD
jgi:hypothetical protein